MATKKEKPHVTILQYDDQLQFKPIVPCITKDLRIQQKELVKEHGRTKTAVVTVDVFEVVELEDKQKIGITYPGFLERIVTALNDNNYSYTIKDKRTCTKQNGFPAPRLDLMSGFRFSQQQLITEALVQDKSGLIGAPTRYGKCLGIHELCMRYDYTPVMAMDVKEGDLLMGPDGTPRKVTGCIRGVDPFYRITPKKGEPFTCNADHILSLQFVAEDKLNRWSVGDIINVPVRDYIGKYKFIQRATRLYYAPLDFKAKDLPVDPWIMGTSVINRPSKEFIINSVSWNDNLAARKLCSKSVNSVLPIEYLTSSKQQRMELLAGIIDCGGRKTGQPEACTIRVSNELLVKDIIRLCRGLGFRATRRVCTATRTYEPVKYNKHTSGDDLTTYSYTYFEVRIFGQLDTIPCRHFKLQMCCPYNKYVATSAFTVEAIGYGEYAGFELEGPNKLFLMWDHLVTHNTTLMVNTIKAFPTLPVCVVAPGVDLVRQLYDDLTGPRGIGNREVRLVGGGKKTESSSDNGVTICSVDSLHLINQDRYKLVLADEPHALVTEERIDKVNGFRFARRYGYGATLKGRFDNRDALITGLFGPILSQRTFKQAVQEGAVCPLHVIFLKIELPIRWYFSRDAAYKDLLFSNPTMASITAELCNRIIPSDWQTLIFIKNEKQAELYAKAIGEGTTVAMAKRMTSDERDMVTSLMRYDIIKRCLCTKIYVQGVTFSDVRVLINCEAGGNNTSAIQKPGRLAEIRPNKRCGIVIDFLFVAPEGTVLGDYRDQNWPCLIHDSFARKIAYEEQGYTVHTANSLDEIQLIIDVIT